MSPQCFHCDGELVPQARFCHRCGTPTFSAYRSRPAGEIDPNERARIKEEVSGASRTPTTTLMTQTVLAPAAARRAAAPLPVWLRVLRMRMWRRWYLWAAVSGVCALALVPRVIGSLEGTARQAQEVYGIVTKLAARCPGDSRRELTGLLATIYGNSGGQLSLLENAMLFEFATRSVPIGQGTCARVAEALSRPDRFDHLLH